jgi:hypothetical protein
MSDTYKTPVAIPDIFLHPVLSENGGSHLPDELSLRALARP